MEEYKSDITSIEEMMKEHEKQPGYKEAIDNLADSMVKAKEQETYEAIESMVDEIKSPKDQFVEDHKTSINDEDLSMFPRPRPSCKHCYGRGYEGWNATKQEIVLCRCIRNRIFQEFREDKLLSYGELKEIYNGPRIARGLPPMEEIETDDKQEDV